MHIWFWFSLLVLLAGCTLAVWPTPIERLAGKNSAFTPFRVLVAAVAAATYLLLYPITSDSVTTGLSGWPNTIFATAFMTLQVFVANGDISGMLDRFRDSSDMLTQMESLYAVFLFSFAPFMAFVLVLTFFQTVSAHAQFLTNRHREVNVFSELNVRSLALAKSIRSKEPETCIVFTGVFAGSRPSANLLAGTRRIGALYFKNSILSLPPTMLKKNVRIRFFIIGDDDTENVWHATSLVAGEEGQRYRERNKVDLYVFSGSVESELALQYRPGTIRARRIDPSRALVYDWLWREPGERSSGLDLFAHAVPDKDGSVVVSAVVVGLGAHGTEMLKALAWYTQMDYDEGSYRLQLNGFDIDPRATSRFRAEYPELAVGIDGRGSTGTRQDAVYSIEVHSGVDATSPALTDALADIQTVTFVFVCTGDDSRNVQVATRLRRDLARRGQSPQILVVREAQDFEAALARLPHQTSIDIDLIDGVSSVYSYDVVITHSEMEYNGLVCHQAWAARDPIEFQRSIDLYWEDEYYYRSSIAIPIHWRARRAAGTPGATLPPAERTPVQRDALRRLEHARWCAFMRSEGFVYGSEKDLVVARTHNLLLPYDDLPEKEQEKDEIDSRDTLLDLRSELAQLEHAHDSATKERKDELARFIAEVEPFVDDYPHVDNCPRITVPPTAQES